MVKLQDVFYAAVSLAAILFILIAAILVFAFLLFYGSPLLILGYVLGLGVFGAAILFAVAAGVLGVWYALYAFIKTRFEGEAKPAAKGNYTLGRIRKS